MCVYVNVCVCSSVYIFVCMHVFTGTFAIAVMEGTDGRGKWTPVPEEYCGAEDQSAAYVPPWAPVTHYSTWSPSSTSHHGPAPRAICLLGQTTPLLPPPSQHCVLASPAPPPRHPHPETKKSGPTVTWMLCVAFWSYGKTEGIWRDDSKRR